LAVFSDFEYLPLKTRVTPIINLKIGYSHIWNQYENGTGTGLGELCIGLNYRLSEKTSIYTKSGVSMTQQSLLIPIRFGVNTDGIFNRFVTVFANRARHVCAGNCH
jgi:hypothetical protein